MKQVIGGRPCGKAKTKEYIAYARIINDESQKMIYRRWALPDGFNNFIEDVGRAPGKDYYLTKRDAGGNYEPVNLEWRRRINRESVIDFIVEYSHEELKQAGVYRLVFDNGMFYIGSSKCLKTRLILWKSVFKTNDVSNKRLTQCVSQCKSVSFEVIEYAPESAIRSRENKYLADFVGDKRLLNRSFDAESNKGVRWTEEEKRLMSEGGKGIPRTGSGRKKAVRDYRQTLMM